MIVFSHACWNTTFSSSNEKDTTVEEQESMSEMCGDVDSYAIQEAVATDFFAWIRLLI